MENTLAQIGERIRMCRKQLGLSQEELADMVNITPQTISNAELGIKAIRAESIAQIALALKVSTDFLLLGRVTEYEQNKWTQKFAQLTPEQYSHLEVIIDHYIAAVKGKKT